MSLPPAEFRPIMGTGAHQPIVDTPVDVIPPTTVPETYSQEYHQVCLSSPPALGALGGPALAAVAEGARPVTEEALHDFFRAPRGPMTAPQAILFIGAVPLSVL